MTKDEAFALDDNMPIVQLSDGELGMFLVWPLSGNGLCGIQVPGEEYHRWIHHDHLHKDGKMIYEVVE